MDVRNGPPATTARSLVPSNSSEFSGTRPPEEDAPPTEELLNAEEEGATLDEDGAASEEDGGWLEVDAATVLLLDDACPEVAAWEEEPVARDEDARLLDGETALEDVDTTPPELPATDATQCPSMEHVLPDGHSASVPQVAPWLVVPPLGQPAQPA